MIQECSAQRCDEFDERLRTWPGHRRARHFHHPSHEYTPMLCEVLARRSDDVNNEDLVDALPEIADPSSVDLLRDVFRWQPPGTISHSSRARRSGQLAAIGTPAAVAVVREVVEDERDKPREAALNELRRRG